MGEMRRLNDVTPREWDASTYSKSQQRDFNRQSELTFEEHNKAKDLQVGGTHYKDMAIQPIEFIMKNGLGFCEANVIKYICRYQSKNKAEDLLKAKHYIDLILEDLKC
jgi:hypothetical protein